jgi:hypothetical protein
MVVVAPATALLIADVADDAAEDIADEAELAVSLDLFALHPEPIRANPAIAAVNATVRLVIARISFLSNWYDGHRHTKPEPIPVRDRPARRKFAGSRAERCGDLSYDPSTSA